MRLPERLRTFFRRRGRVSTRNPYDRAVQNDATKDLVSRRSFSRTVATVGSVLAFLGIRRGGLARKARASEEPPVEAARRDARWGMTIDLDRCTGCGACVVACRTENNVPSFGWEERARGTGIYWMDLLTVQEDQLETRAHADALPLPCMHCEDPPCVPVCPVGATYQTEDGIVAQLYDRCIGCRYCELACPYGRRYFNWSAPEWPDAHRNFLNPDVSLRPSGVVDKCTFCHHRVRKAHEDARLDDRTPTDQEMQRLPACAEVCPAEAITFGNLNDPETAVSQLAESPRSFRLLDHVGTRPKVVYLGKDRRK